MTHPDLSQTPGVVEAVFDRIVAAAANLNHSPDEISTTSDGTLADLLIQMKPKILSDALAAGGQQEVKRTKAAREFTLEEVVDAFGLKYSTVVSAETSIQQTWNIQDVPETQNFQMTPCLGKTLVKVLDPCVRIWLITDSIASLIENYSKNFERSSEATCGTALDFILNECLTVMVS